MGVLCKFFFAGGCFPTGVRFFTANRIWNDYWRITMLGSSSSLRFCRAKNMRHHQPLRARVVVTSLLPPQAPGPCRIQSAVPLRHRRPSRGASRTRPTDRTACRYRHGQDLDGKLCLGCQFLQFGLDSPSLLIYLLSGLESSITPPTLFLSSFLDLISQNWFDSQRGTKRQDCPGRSWFCGNSAGLRCSH